jgi:integrase
MPKVPPGIYKRGATYSVVIDHGRDANGKRLKKWHSGFQTLALARAAQRRLLDEREQQRAVTPDKLTVEQYLTQWLDLIKPTATAPGTAGRGHRGRVGVGTWSSYRGDLRAYVFSRPLGDMRLQAIKSRDLEALYDALEREGKRDGSGLSPKTLRNLHGILHRAFEQAVKRGVLSGNPATGVQPLKVERPRHTVWSLSELHRFLAAVRDDDFLPGWLLLATTGMRRAEVLGLCWDDIDLDAHRVTVRWTLGTVDAKPTWKPPKSKAAERTMPLAAQAAESLRAWRSKQDAVRAAVGPQWLDVNEDWRGSTRAGVVFTDALGRFLRPDTVSSWFAAKVRAAQLPRIRLHDLRHTYASVALQGAKNMAQMKQISERLGHSELAVTLQIYAHLLPDVGSDLVDELDRQILGTVLEAEPDAAVPLRLATG